MPEEKKVYIARLRKGFGSCKVFARDEADARKAALAAYRYNSEMNNPSMGADEVVESVELDPDQAMDSVMAQPASQFGPEPVRSPLDAEAR